MNISSSKRFQVYLLLLLLLLACVSFAQRGGGGSSRSSSSSSRSRRNHYYGSTYHSNENCTIINGTKTCTYVDEPLSGTAIAIIIGVVAVIIGAAAYSSNKQEEARKVKIEAIFKQYEAKSQANPSTLDEQQKIALLDYFMKTKYTIVVNVKNNSEKFFCQVNVTDLKKQSEYKYRIKLSGSDQVGKSKFDGVLIFRDDGIGLKLSKVYDDRTKAGQTGNWQNLLYQGFGNPNQITGQWSYLGYQNSLQYSGYWNMLQL